MESLIKVYTGTGNFDSEQYFTVLYNKIPSKYNFTIEPEDQTFEISEICFNKVKHLFKNIIGYREYIEDSLSDEEATVEYTDQSTFALDLVGTVEEIEGQLKLNANESVRCLTVAADNKVIYICWNKIVILYSPEEPIESIKKLVNDIFNALPKAQKEDKAARVGLIKFSNGEYYTSFSDIRKTSVNIEENYNDDFLPVYKDIINFLNQRESGLVLLWGKPGVGKTNLIRYLCSSIPKDYVIVPNSVASRLGDPDFISYITSCKDYVFILEDCEQLLVDREDNPWNNAITTILNMADGLLSDIVNIKFICTFNAAVDKIDKALLRKGRCFAKYEFKELCTEKVAALDAKYQLSLPEIKPMTLAEVYNSEKTDYSEDTKKMNKIGF